MRLFVGLDLPPDVVGNLENLLEKLRPTARIQWSPPANLHLTTKFIGEWPEDRLPELQAALGALPPRPAIPLHIRGAGRSRGRHRSRHLRAGNRKRKAGLLAAPDIGPH